MNLLLYIIADTINMTNESTNNAKPFVIATPTISFEKKKTLTGKFPANVARKLCNIKRVLVVEYL